MSNSPIESLEHATKLASDLCENIGLDSRKVYKSVNTLDNSKFKDLALRYDFVDIVAGFDDKIIYLNIGKAEQKHLLHEMTHALDLYFGGRDFASRNFNNPVITKKVDSISDYTDYSKGLSYANYRNQRTERLAFTLQELPIEEFTRFWKMCVVGGNHYV